MLEYALAYAGLGWPVVPVHWVENGACSCGDTSEKHTSAGKHPLTTHGHLDATTDAAKITAWWTKWPRANIGIATGDRSGVMVFDIDPRNTGDETYDALQVQGKTLDEAMVVRSGGGGTHIYLRCPEPWAGNNKLFTGIDLKANGGFVVAPPSRTTGTYEWLDDSDPTENGVLPPDPPQWLAEMMRKPPPPAAARGKGAPPSRYTIHLSDEESVEIKAALSVLAQTDVVHDRNAWVDVGMALHSTMAQGAFELWSEWSQHSHKYDHHDAVRVWNSFDAWRSNGITLGTLWKMAEGHGWERPLPKVVARTHAVETDEQPIRQPMPEHLYHVPGKLQMFVNWTLDTAVMRQPKTTVAAALALGSTAMAQRFAWGGTRTGIYQIAIAPTASGKDHPRKCIKRVLAHAGLDAKLLGEEFKSGSALVRAVGSMPHGITLIDEYGLYLQGITRKDASQHKREVAEVAMKLYTASGDRYDGAEYADAKTNKREPIMHPCLTVYGTSTLATFAPALTGGHVVDGFLNRHLIIESETPSPEPEWFPSEEQAPARLVEWLAAIASWRPPGAGDMVGVLPEQPIVMGSDMSAMQAIRAFGDEVRKRMADLRASGREAGLDAIWGRAVEQAKRVAMVLAGSEWDGHSVPRVTLLHAKWAIDYVRHCTETAVGLVEEHVSDSDSDAICKQLRKAIDGAGSRGKTHPELSACCRLFRAATMFHREDAMKKLAAEGYRLAEVDTGYAKGRKRRAYVHERYLQQEGA
jgi:hypothetical protein